MTTKELIEKLTELDPEGTQTIAVSAFGGIGGFGKEVTDVSVGFDWDNGKIMLHTKNPLTLYRPPTSKSTRGE